MIIEEIAVHQGPDHAWCGMPARPMLDSCAGAAMRDESGKIRYRPMISFTARTVRDRLTSEILKALSEKSPDALDATDAESMLKW
jgi:hypothetical protein